MHFYAYIRRKDEKYLVVSIKIRIFARFLYISRGI